MSAVSAAALFAGVAGLGFAARADETSGTSTQSKTNTVAAAQPAELSEITVTATKSGAQKLSRVPLAIQAFTERTLASRDVHDGSDLIQLIPGASEQSEVGAGYKIFSFRGSGAGGPVGDGMIGYYLDDTPFGVPNNQSAPPLQYFDIENVEVLRGPQGTLYGQGSMGGAIIYHTKNPDLDHYTGEVEASVSGTNDAGSPNHSEAAAVSIPLIKDQLGLRVSGSYDYKAGYEDIYQGAPTGTPYKKDANDIRSTDLQAVLLWRPTDRLTVRMRAWTFSTSQDYLQVMTSVSPPYAAYQGTVAGYDNRRADYFSNSVTYKFDGLTLTNATSYQRSLPGGFGTALNLGGSLGIGTLLNGGDAQNFVNEFRLATSGPGPFHWLGGVFYQNARGLYTYNIAFPTLHIAGDTTTRTQNESVFTEVSYDLFGGKLVPGVGLRYFTDDRKALSHSSGVAAFSQSNPEKVTWRANIAYYPAYDWMLFINAGTGFRSGILQSQAQATAVTNDGVPSGLALTPDSLLNIEGGFKGSFFDRTVHLSTSAYRIKYSNLQSAFNTSIGLSAFANLGDAETYGLDVDLAWRTPVPGLNLSFIGNVNHSEFTNVHSAFAASNARSANGQPLYNTPPYNVRLDLAYERTILPGWDLFANGSATALGKIKNQDATVNMLKAYSLYNASIGVRHNDYQIKLYAENLSDYRGPTAANGATLLAGPRPLTVGVNLNVKFR
ncbi:MAG: TonB-dependent receptor plug domain-containing protein [Caulobacteraceae bacterium]|nr:TonB-dependent receptor plug domain-containing protein [Caulobacteraceae bacterium]